MRSALFVNACTIIVIACCVVVSQDRKRKHAGNSSSNIFKRILRNSVIRRGRIFTLAESRQKQLSGAAKWDASCNTHLSMAEQEDFYNVTHSCVSVAEPKTNKGLKLDLMVLEEKTHELQLNETLSLVT